MTGPGLSPSTAGFIILIVASSYVAFWIHELTHWFAGRLVRSDPEIHFSYIAIPVRVKHRRLDDVSDQAIRTFGAVPLVLWYFFALAVGSFFILGVNSWTLFAAFVFFIAASGFSKGDLIAVERPKEYRDLTRKDDLPGGSGYWTILTRLL